MAWGALVVVDAGCQLAVDELSLAGHDLSMGQDTPDQWAAVLRLLGRWEGTATGNPGSGNQVRRYELVLRGRFVLGTTKSDWLPTEADPEGEAHEDLCLISYDRAAGQAVMRSFFVEGFACEYRCVELSGDLSRIVFEADVVENGPGGLRARETFLFHTDDDLESHFDLANGSAEFKSYTVERLQRVSEVSGG